MDKIFAQPWSDYELIDAGNNKKLERWGEVVTIRPEINAYFKPGKSIEYWNSMASAEFIPHSSTKGSWKIKPGVSENWQINYKQFVFNLKFTTFKHVGLFPEQQFNWAWLQSEIKSNSKFLNLFGYTGAASVVARGLGADVFHCDSIKSVNEWGKTNMTSSGLAHIHWVTEDAMKFAGREIKRKNKYHIIFMDPPAFGLSINKKRWKIENEFKNLINNGVELLEAGGTIVLNTYSPRLDATKIKDFLKQHNSIGHFEIKTLCIQSTTGKRLEFGIRTFIKKEL